MAATIRGVAGELRWGYQRAATLGSWTITHTVAGTSITAEIVSADRLRLAQQPIAFIVPRTDRPAWRWPVHSLQIAGATLTASLGPQED